MTRLFLLLALAACGTANKDARPSGSDSPSASRAEGTPCTEDVELACPDGQIDACEKALSEESPDAGDTGTMMAVEHGRMGKLARAGNHRCVPK